MAYLFGQNYKWPHSVTEVSDKMVIITPKCQDTSYIMHCHRYWPVQNFGHVFQIREDSLFHQVVSKGGSLCGKEHTIVSLQLQASRSNLSPNLSCVIHLFIKILGENYDIIHVYQTK